MDDFRSNLNGLPGPIIVISVHVGIRGIYYTYLLLPRPNGKTPELWKSVRIPTPARNVAVLSHH